MTACSGTRCSTTPESVSACSRPNIRAMPCRTHRPAHDPVTDRQPVFRPFRKPGPPAAHEDAAVLYYTVTTIGGNGRLADSSPLKRLGWELNQAVAIEVVDEVILVTASSAGPFSVTSQHHLHLPAEIRRFYRIQAGDRLTGCRRTRTTTPGALSTNPACISWCSANTRTYGLAAIPSRLGTPCPPCASISERRPERARRHAHRNEHARFGWAEAGPEEPSRGRQYARDVSGSLGAIDQLPYHFCGRFRSGNVTGFVSGGSNGPGLRARPIASLIASSAIRSSTRNLSARSTSESTDHPTLRS